SQTNIQAARRAGGPGEGIREKFVTVSSSVVRISSRPTDMSTYRRCDLYMNDGRSAHTLEPGSSRSPQRRGEELTRFSALTSIRGNPPSREAPADRALLVRLRLRSGATPRACATLRAASSHGHPVTIPFARTGAPPLARVKGSCASAGLRLLRPVTRFTP